MEGDHTSRRQAYALSAKLRAFGRLALTDDKPADPWGLYERMGAYMNSGAQR